MQKSLPRHGTRAEDSQHSSVRPDYGDQAPVQPPSSQVGSTHGSPLADSEGEQTTPTSSDREISAQIDSSTTLMGEISRLPKAVVIPQRRPSDRARGFVRAYAPDLLRCDIDQATFLRFIDGLNRSVACNAAVEAVGLAGEAVGAVPGSEFVGAPIIGTALQVAAGAYKEVNARKGQNGYLTKVNDELFLPRGLYCLIMCYDVKSRSNVVRPGQSDSPSHIIRHGISQGPNSGRLRSHDGILGASNFPAIAELIYPDPKYFPENNLEEDGSEGRTSPGIWDSGRSKVKTMWVAQADKEDLKSQVKFQKKNPTSPINVLMDPKAELNEKDRQKQKKREAEQEKKEKKREREAEKRALKYPDKAPKAHEPKEGILYVMILNLPSTGYGDANGGPSPGLGAA